MATPTSPEVRPAPNLIYKPRNPNSYRPGIGLIGCGGISRHHLQAYRNGGYHVAAICDLNAELARQKRDEYYPEAEVYDDYRAVLRSDAIEVVDVATHPRARIPIVTEAILAGKHVLSQKPFVLDLDVGEELVALAHKHNVKLAVNQNGRWAPHFSWARQAIREGHLGEVYAARLAVHWDHTWVRGTPFEKIYHLILYDYAIHSFDIVRCFLAGHPARRVFASLQRTPIQDIEPPLMAQVVVEFENAQASLIFDAQTRFAPRNQTVIIGSRGTLHSVGPHEKQQDLSLTNAEGTCRPELEGSWFPDGFQGTMGELLCSIEERREPTINAEDNLKSLALCFAALASAERSEPIEPGTVRNLASLA